MSTSLPASASPEDHAEVLCPYNPDNKPWWQIPDDDYLYDHLAEHLLGARRRNELYHLLTESAPDGLWGHLVDLPVIWQECQSFPDQNGAATFLAALICLKSTINNLSDLSAPALPFGTLPTPVAAIASFPSPEE